MKNLNISKGYYEVQLSEDAPTWLINLSDDAISATYEQVKNAVEKAQKLADAENIAETKEELKEAINETVKFQKRIICAIVGGHAYHELLDYLSPNDTPVDPFDYKVKIGDVMAALLVVFVTEIHGEHTQRLTNLMNQPKKKRPRKK